MSSFSVIFSIYDLCSVSAPHPIAFALGELDDALYSAIGTWSWIVIVTSTETEMNIEPVISTLIWIWICSVISILFSIVTQIDGGNVIWIWSSISTALILSRNGTAISISSANLL